MTEEETQQVPKEEETSNAVEPSEKTEEEVSEEPAQETAEQ